MYRWHQILKKTYKENFNYKFSGASGGMAAGLKAILKGSNISGPEYIIKNTKLKTLVPKCKYIIVGEGKFDKTSLLDKGTFFLAKYAKSKGAVVIGLFGQISDKNLIDKKIFDYVIDLSKLVKKEGLKRDYYLKSKNYKIFKIAGKLISNIIESNETK